MAYVPLRWARHYMSPPPPAWAHTRHACSHARSLRPHYCAHALGPRLQPCCCGGLLRKGCGQRGLSQSQVQDLCWQQAGQGQVRRQGFWVGF